jgi:hypothetical protein
MSEGAPYRYTRSDVAWLVEGENHRYAVLVPRKRQVWIGKDGSGRLREERGAPIFLGARDARDWGPTSPLEGIVDDAYAAGELARVSTAELPRERDALRAVLRASAADGEPMSVAVLTAGLSYLRETVPPPDIAELLYALITTESGVRSDGPVTDHAGRKGEGYSVDLTASRNAKGGAQRLSVIFDPTTHGLLEDARILIEPDPTIDASPPVTIGWSTYLDARMVASTRED